MTRSVPGLHVVTDDRVLGLADFQRRAREVLTVGGAGVALHVRGPASSGAALYRAAAELIRPARDAGALLLVNDRVDLALVLEMDGVHLGERSLPPVEARRVLGAGPRMGSSVHGVEGARDAEEGGAEYLVVGTVFATRSHPGRAGAGVPRIREVADAVAVPILAIGGVTPGRVREVLDAGARGVAALSGVWNAPSPAGAVEEYLSALNA